MATVKKAATAQVVNPALPLDQIIAAAVAAALGQTAAPKAAAPVAAAKTVAAPVVSGLTPNDLSGAVMQCNGAPYSAKSKSGKTRGQSVRGYLTNGQKFTGTIYIERS